jgi:hypothetical protein
MVIDRNVVDQNVGLVKGARIVPHRPVLHAANRPL